MVNSGTKRRRASTYRDSGRSRKARFRTPSPPAKEDTGSVSSSFYKTPTTKRTAFHAGLTEQGTTVYAKNMETQIAAEARGVTRKNVPLDEFRSIYLCDLTTKAEQKLDVKPIKRVGEGSWDEPQFWGRLRHWLSDEVRFIRLSVLC